MYVINKYDLMLHENNWIIFENEQDKLWTATSLVKRTVPELQIYFLQCKTIFAKSVVQKST